jgi:imidazolonepropionase-like amidohydrolase
MRKTPILGLLGLFLALHGGDAQTNSSAAPPSRIALRAARLMDGKRDTIITNAVILIEHQKIIAVGTGLTIPVGTTVIDLGDQTLLPGLIDTHTHLLLEMDGENLRYKDDGMLRVVATESTAERVLLGAKLGREDLEAGITTVRDLGNSGVNGDVALRDAIFRGWVRGPTVVPSTRALAAPGGQFMRLIPEAQKIIEQEYVTINGPESARQAVRQALYDGAWCIKVIVNGSPADVTLDELKAIVDQAHTSKVKVAAHAVDDHATRIAAQAGVDSIEHAFEIQDDVLKLMAQKHIFLVPTDSTEEGYFAMENGNRPMSTEERARAMEKYKTLVARNGDRLRRAIAAGVPIAAGSDVWQLWPGKTRGQASLVMLEAYAAEGMKPADIIRSVTSSAAELIGAQFEVGTIEKGKYADIIAVPGDPLNDATALEHAKFVMRGGEIIRNQTQK